ncbi:MAG: Maf family protein [Candidatus Eisenbacteria bacterium]
MEIILASTSPHRRRLLKRLGLPFRCIAPSIEEEVPRDGEEAGRVVVRNALAKAIGAVADHPGAIIIGSDQLAQCGGDVLGKPGSHERAVEQLMRLAGREHRLLTGLAVVQAPCAAGGSDDLPGRTALVINHLAMRSFTREEAEAYVRRELPLDCAGAYRAEGLGVVLFEHMRGDDPSAIQGLPLIALTRLLRAFGVDPLTFDRDVP